MKHHLLLRVFRPYCRLASHHTSVIVKHMYSQQHYWMYTRCLQRMPGRKQRNEAPSIFKLQSVQPMGGAQAQLWIDELNVLPDVHMHFRIQVTIVLAHYTRPSFRPLLLITCPETMHPVTNQSSAIDFCTHIEKAFCALTCTPGSKFFRKQPQCKIRANSAKVSMTLASG